ncbi:MAG: hypothetical protein Q4P18_00240 [Methanobrevibacter sp.]|uniref:hypothetical protein n=1 Tax=Methanobrevibacter sp. TaxID=66852 RepID=UPI0026E046C8|nr:hypothetical protein [Methanobrevibacter sp.]MDO5847951.1 hypothetical protein [Methanobrevibacter sp.]
MGFYSNSTPAYRRINELTGDIHLCEDFKQEIEARGIPLYKAYSIQKRLLFEAEEEKLKTKEDVDKRIMELLDENTKNDITSDYANKCSTCEGATKIPPMPKEVTKPKGFVSGLPPKEEIFIPPKGRDLAKQNEMTDRELLNKIALQNEKIINQNKLILQELRKLGNR